MAADLGWVRCRLSSCLSELSWVYVPLVYKQAIISCVKAVSYTVPVVVKRHHEGYLVSFFYEVNEWAHISVFFSGCGGNEADSTLCKFFLYSVVSSSIFVFVSLWIVPAIPTISWLASICVCVDVIVDGSTFG